MNAENKTLVSPLRYPGGKAFLAPFVAEILALNELRPEILVEPFAGGASVSLHLLGLDRVDSIALYDLDPLVSGFWWTVFNRRALLIDKLDREPVTIDQWRTIKDQKINGHCTNAWKCLFLNRTSFSGILNSSSGPIGGQKQKSAYALDCRFYKDTIASRIEELWEMRHRVYDIGTQSYSKTLRDYEAERNFASCFYLDPPFFHKAEKLYNFYFKSDEHSSFLEEVRDLQKPWVLSYDYCSEAVTLLRRLGLRYRIVPVNYTAANSTSPNPKKELVSSNLDLPRIKKS
ncbi:DNA adenine methylase [Novipirellula sp.]|uniref:DNA adenine methylase n=1 Tax=Novipirellula sp. TaxID=2795430 RepID=UPI003562A233